MVCRNRVCISEISRCLQANESTSVDVAAAVQSRHHSAASSFSFSNVVDGEGSRLVETLTYIKNRDTEGDISRLETNRAMKPGITLGTCHHCTFTGELLPTNHYKWTKSISHEYLSKSIHDFLSGWLCRSSIPSLAKRDALRNSWSHAFLDTWISWFPIKIVIPD